LICRKETPQTQRTNFALTNGIAKEANKAFGYPADKTLKIAQSLYETKIVVLPAY
jgi:DNA topoisomerase IA